MRHAILIIFFGITVLSKAQNNYSKQNYFTTKDGLTNNTVYCIKKDSRGFLWIGTKEGLNRYDGLEFKKYFTEKDITHSLSSNNIFDIVEYRYGQLLIGTSNGISVLNTITGEFENEKIKFPPLRYGSNVIINSFFKDKKGQIWVNEDGELDILDSNLHYIERFTDLPWTKVLKGIFLRFETWRMDSAGRIWLPGNQLYIIDFAAKQVWNYNNNPHNLPYFRYKSFRSIWLDEDNKTVWYAPWGLGLFKYDPTTNKSQQQLFNIREAGEARSINDIFKNNSGKLICVSGLGLYEVDPVSMKYSLINETSLGITLYHDRNNNMYWMGTFSGLFQYTELPSVKEIEISNDGKHPSNCYDIINTLNNNLYAVFNNNLVEMQKNRVDYKLYNLPVAKRIFTFSMCEDKKGVIWLATSDGVIQFNTIAKTFSRPAILPESSKHAHFNNVFCDSEGTVWMTTISAINNVYIYKFNQLHCEFEIINDSIIQLNNVNTGVTNSISSITEDYKHNIWMTTSRGNGLLRFNRQLNVWDVFPKEHSINKLVLRRPYVSIIAMNRYLWLTDFYGNGLVRYDPEKDEVKQFTRNNGLLSDFISNVNADNKENLWILSEKGITKFNTNTYKTKSNNLSNIEISAYETNVSVYDSVSTSIVYGYKNSLAFIQINKILNTPALPIPIINSVTIYDQQQVIDPSRKFILKHNENNISIDFTAVQFEDADKIRFAYQLSDIDKDWQYANIRRTVQYSNLATGDYIFKIKTGNENDKWSTAYSLLIFTIKPPFWVTWWFVLLVIGTITATIFWLVRKRIQNIRNKAELKQKIAETEMMALRAQMNPHFIFNCLSAIDNMIQTNQKEKATTYLNQFAKLIRLILESSAKNLVPFYKDFESLKLYIQLEQFRSNNKFAFELQADPELLNSGIMVPPLLVQPFVENAIHHGLLNKSDSDKLLNINISLEKDYIKYTVMDNGVGRQKAMELNAINKSGHISYGIEIAQKRISMHNHNEVHPGVVITDLTNNNMPTGTRVQFWLWVN